MTGRTGRPVTGNGPTEHTIKEQAIRPVTEKLPTELFDITARGYAVLHCDRDWRFIHTQQEYWMRDRYTDHIT